MGRPFIQLQTRRGWLGPLCLALVIAVLCAKGSSAGGTQTSYTMADLLALESRESWGELIEHLEDVSPPNRDQKWEALAEKAAIQRLAGTGDNEQTLFETEALLKRFAFLRKSKPFMKTRAEMGLKGFEACYDSSSSGAECTPRLLAFVDADPDPASP